MAGTEHDVSKRRAEEALRQQQAIAESKAIARTLKATKGKRQ
jgi:hypothetical protein